QRELVTLEYATDPYVSRMPSGMRAIVTRRAAARVAGVPSRARRGKRVSGGRLARLATSIRVGGDRDEPTRRRPGCDPGAVPRLSRAPGEAPARPAPAQPARPLRRRAADPVEGPPEVGPAPGRVRRRAGGLAAGDPDPPAGRRRAQGRPAGRGSAV